MKRRLTLILLAVFLMTSFSSVALANDSGIYELPKPVTVHVDGLYLVSDVLPYIDHGRTLLPLRAAAQSLGAKVQWLQDKKIAIISKGNTTVVFKYQSKSYLINGQKHYLDVPLQIKNGRIMLPLRAFAEALNTRVIWDGSIADVKILTGGPVHEPNLPSDTPSEFAWLVQKYYLPSKSNSGIEGSWINRYHDTSDGVTSSGFNYLFVTKVGNNKYIATDIHINTSMLAQGLPLTIAFSSPGRTSKGKNTYIFGSKKQMPIYYKCGGIDWEPFVYDEYRLDGNRLTLFNSISGMTINDAQSISCHTLYERF